jgi:hypothetical protein
MLSWLSMIVLGSSNVAKEGSIPSVVAKIEESRRRSLENLLESSISSISTEFLSTDRFVVVINSLADAFRQVEHKSLSITITTLVESKFLLLLEFIQSDLVLKNIFFPGMEDLMSLTRLLYPKAKDPFFQKISLADLQTQIDNHSDFIFNVDHSSHHSCSDS